MTSIASPDSMGTVSPTTVARSAAQVLDALQFLPSNNQAAAIAAVYRLVMIERGLDPAQELARVERVMWDAERESLRTEFEACRQYIAQEMT